MTSEYTVFLFQNAILTGLILSSPILGIILFIGILCSLFQASTQINEQNLSFIPKIVSVFFSIFFFGPWMLQYILEYIKNIFMILPDIIQ